MTEPSRYEGPGSALDHRARAVPRSDCRDRSSGGGEGADLTQLSADRSASGVGLSEADDPVRAALEAVERALAGRDLQAGDAVVLFSAGFRDPVGAFERAADAVSPARLVACSSDGAFTAAATIAEGCCAAHLSSRRLRLGIARCDLGCELAGAARAAAEQARAQATAEGEGRHAALVLLSDGLAGDQREIVRGAYEVTGAAVPIVGGAAGDDLRISRTWQYADGASTNSVVALWIESSEPIGVGVAHGWRPASAPMLVTRAEGNVIVELEGRPARDAYLETRNRPLPDGQPFATFAMDHPLGIPNARGRYDVRHVLDATDGGLAMFAYVPESTVVQVMEASAEELLEGAEEAACQAHGELAGPAATVLAFSCAARKPILGDAVVEEPRRIASACGTSRLCGFFTYGEFGRVTGSTGFHNASVAVLALSA